MNIPILCQDRLLTFPLQPLLFSSPDEPPDTSESPFLISPGSLLQLCFISSLRPNSRVCVRLCIHLHFLFIHLIAHFSSLLEDCFFQLFSDSRVPRQDKWSKVSMNESRQILEERIFTLFVLELASA